MTFFRTIDSTSEAEQLMDLVWRKAPLFMRASLGVQHTEKPYRPPVPQNMHNQFVAMIDEGKDVDTIAQQTGFSRHTVRKHTIKARANLRARDNSRRGRPPG